MTFEEFVAARAPALLRYAVMLTGDRELALDLAQDTMVKAHLRWRRIGAVDRPELYVKRMLTNEYLSWRRGSWFRRVVLHAETPELARSGLAEPDHAEATAERDHMWAALATLPRQQRAAVVLRFYEQLADQEIADLLDCKVGTVRGYISRALVTLRATVVAGTDPRVFRSTP